MHSLRTHPELLHRLHDEALAEAQALRREAIADFWRSADGLLASATTQARRTAERWTRSLQRHTRLRAVGG